MTENQFTARVYADGRLCIAAPVLQRYAELTGEHRKVLFIGPYKNIENSWVHILWRPVTGSFKEYDLSVRGRVLFNAPPRSRPYKPGTTYPVTVSKKGIFIQIGKASGDNYGEGTPREVRSTKPPKKKGTKRPARRIPRTPKKSPRRIDKLQAEFEGLVRERMVKLLQTDMSDVTLAQLAAVMPEITVGELIGRT